MPEINARPPRDNLVRALQPGLELRDASDGQMPTLVSNFAVFDEWTEIDSWFEGRFMERISPGAFRKTMRENRGQIKPLFQHGADPQVGEKPLGTITDLREDEGHAVGEVQLLDTVYNRELLPGLKAGLYGSSFRFQVMREDINQDPEPGEMNPHGLPERTIKEVRLFEFGPVTFPAYSGTPTGVRSLALLPVGLVAGDDPELEHFIAKHVSVSVPRAVLPGLDDGETDVTSFSVREVAVESEPSQDAPPDTDEAPDDGDAAQDEHPAEAAPLSEGEAAASVTSEVRDDKESTMENLTTRAEIVERQSVVQARLEQIAAEYGAAMLPEDIDREFDELGEEKLSLATQLAAFEKRERLIGVKVEKPDNVEREPRSGNGNPRPMPDNLFALDEYRMFSRTQDEHRQLLQDGARKIVEGMVFPHDRANREDVQGHIERLLLKDNRECDIARRIITTSSPTYTRAFGKTLLGQPLSPEESRAMGLTDNLGGYAVPAALDPTVVLTSDGAINPIRAISRVETITGDTWKGVTSDGVTATRTTEAAQATDDAPGFGGPEITPTRVHCWIPFSYEIGMDFAGIQSELARMLQDAKDVEEADQFVNGNGDPEGVVAGLAATSHVTSETVNAFELADIYHVKDKLPPRFQGRASWVANSSFYSEIRQLDQYGGGAFWANLGPGLPQSLLGKPTYEASEMASTSVSGDDVLLIGDFSYYCIVDRVGMSIELVPQVFGANQRPTGQRGLYAFWRNSAEILSDNAFRVLTIGLTS